MRWSIRTLLRSFLLAGGIVYLVSGVLTDTPTYLLIGGIAAAFGAFGLWIEYRSDPE